jgi:hypothetical protein
VLTKGVYWGEPCCSRGLSLRRRVLLTLCLRDYFVLTKRVSWGGVQVRTVCDVAPSYFMFEMVTSCLLNESFGVVCR